MYAKVFAAAFLTVCFVALAHAATAAEQGTHQGTVVSAAVDDLKRIR